MKKRLLAILLSLSLIVGLFPTAVFAEGYVAKIGDAEYATLQEAIDNVTNGDTITLLAAITENVILTEEVGLTYTIDGDHNTMNGTIVVKALSDTNDNRRITIKNINFETTASNVDFISSVETNHYPRITVEGCSFTGSGDDTTVAVRLKSSSSAVIRNCTGTKLHSFLQNTSGWNITVENITVTDSNGGLAMGTVQGANIKDCKITTETYGIRFDAQYNNDATVEDCEVDAFIPVVVRKASVDSEITFEGENTMTASNTDGIWCAVGTSEYETNGSLPTAPTGKVTINIEDENLSDEGVVGEYVFVAVVDGVKYENFEVALKALKENSTLTLYRDVTITDTWDCRNTGAKITVPVIIDGKGKTIKLTGAVDDKNWNTVFRFEADATVKNLTIDASEATGIQRGISSKLSIVVENCNFIGNGTTAKRAIIFGEGAGTALSDVTASVTGSSFTNWSYGVSDNQSGKDAKSVTITGSDFTNSNVLVSASENVTFTDNVMDNGYVNITSYSPENNLNVTATGNTLDEDFAANNKINASTINAQEGFDLPAVKVNENKYYKTIEEALAEAVEGDVIYLLEDVKVDEMLYITKGGITIDGNGFTITASNNFAMGLHGQTNLVKIENNAEQGYTGNNVTLKNLKIKTTAANKHALDVWGATGVVLENVTLDHTTAEKGAPLVVNTSAVKVKGTFEVITGETSWYAINVDPRSTTASIDMSEVTSLTFTDNSQSGRVFIWADNAPAGTEGLVEMPAIEGLCEFTAGGKSYVNLEHAFGMWDVTTNPSCTEPGEETRVCGNCGKPETQSIPAYGHSDANEDEVCDVCRANLDPHNWSDDFKNNDEYHWRYCQNCGKKKTRHPHVDANKDGHCDACDFIITTTGRENPVTGVTADMLK